MFKKKKTAKRVVDKMRLPSILKTKQRQKEVKFRKNFGPTLIIIFILWICLTTMFFFVDPNIPTAVPIFFILIFFTLLFTLSTLLANTRRGLIISIGMTLFLILIYLGVGTIINLILITIIGILIEVYFIKA
jgi:hypothetical protein